ncbi:hypothetical protein MAC_06327 [Metarhizium acridum CQMa 102]|uniref:Uncharacterized protein n=1 Tax=Metarhizium acridum (strain CQMa 102) TaxID=655827 RepID=E9E8X9_METAQ|nr:uncharacterized protein MAC_06327 [Metarhizium acridum CQMa 102]EFY87615.1 hypothetical protein MAC_06327 [Metarhizium acridum CQMa 102]
MSAPPYKQILEWLDSVIEGLEGSANNIETQAEDAKPGFITTLTHAIPSDEPTALPTPAKAQTPISNTIISSVAAPTPLAPNLPQLPPSSETPSPPPSDSSVSSASSLSSASSTSAESKASTPPPPVASLSPTSGLVLPTGLPVASSVTLPYLPPTTFATQPVGSGTSLAGLPATASPSDPNSPSQENKGLLAPPGTTGEVRDSSRAIGIAFGSLSQ